MTDGYYVALCGGVGGAKLAQGLARILPGEALKIVVNVGDDFEHIALRICPDLDTVLYALAGVANRAQGWGREEESWNVLHELRRLGGEDWFLLGDKDIALHLLRTALLAQGRSLTEVTAELARRLGVETPILPVTDDRLSTLIETRAGLLPFQDYFVRLRCAPEVTGLRFAGADTARLNPALEEALANPALKGVIVCPSNPYLSIGPMLAVAPLRTQLAALKCPVLAVSPIVGGAAIKGPAAKMMRELGQPPSAATIADLYADFVQKVLVDSTDAALAENDPRLAVAPTVMHAEQDRLALARICLDLIRNMQRT